MSPDGRVTVTQQLGVAHWVTWPPGHVASENGPPVLLFIVNVNVCTGQRVVLVELLVVELVDVDELVDDEDDELLELVEVEELDDDEDELDDDDVELEELDDVELDVDELVLLDVDVEDEVVVLVEDDVDEEDDDVEVEDVLVELVDDEVLELVDDVVLLDDEEDDDEVLLDVDELLVVGATVDVDEVELVVVVLASGQRPRAIGFLIWKTSASLRLICASGPKRTW